MEKVIEFVDENNRLKKYLEECLLEEKIYYEIKIEERWTKNYKQASKYYQVYCLYVNKDKLERVDEIIKEYENGDIITEGIEELDSIEDEKYNNKFKIFTLKNFLKYYWIILIVIGLLIVIGMKIKF